MDNLLLEAGVIRANIDLGVYRLVAVQKAAYRVASRCTVILGQVTGTTLPIAVTFASGTSEETANEAARAFFQELLDQELREKVGDETRAVRAVILAHAFSRTGLVEK